MDTIPFHLILFALDIIVLGGLFFWIWSRQNVGRARSDARNSSARHFNAGHFHFSRFERSLYAPVAARPPSFAWDITGVVIFGGLGLACLAFLSLLVSTRFVQRHIYHFNVLQCIVEGIAFHGTLFLIGAASLLFWNRRRFSAVFLGCCALFLAAFSFNILYWEPYHLRVEHYEIRTTKLTKPLRIVFVSDIQTDRVGFHERNTLRKIQQQNADLIILGGDYIQIFGAAQEYRLREEFRQLLLTYPLKAPLGVYAIVGNVRGNASVNDFHMFYGTSVTFDWRTKTLHNLGADQGWDPPIDLVLLSLEDSVGGLGERGLTESGNFIVMVGHYPNFAIDGYTDLEDGEFWSGYRNADRAPDLMLAGHTHGGQVVIPFHGPMHWKGDEYLHQVPRTMWSGFFLYPNGGHLLVTRGTGLSRGRGPRIRLFCPAEISVIDLIPK